MPSDSARPAHVSMQTIANAVGVSRMSVSLALHGKPGRVSEAKRQIIIKKAKELGYRLDPKISSLTTYLAERRRQPGIREEIPYLHVVKRAYGHEQGASHFFEYAKEHASYHGYRLEPYILGFGGYTATQLERIWESRGVQGAFLAPLHKTDRLPDFNWEKYAWIAFGDSSRQLPVHRVDTDFRHAALSTFKQLHQMGYQRIGMATAETTDLNLNFALSNAATTYYQAVPAKQRVPLFVKDKIGDPSVREKLISRWLETHRIDAVISNDTTYSFFRELPLVKKRKIGFAAHVLSPDNHENLAGMQRSRESLGKTSVELLLSQITHGVRGTVPAPVRTLIEGYWVDGPTVRKKRGNFPLPQCLL